MRKWLRWGAPALAGALAVAALPAALALAEPSSAAGRSTVAAAAVVASPPLAAGDAFVPVSSFTLTSGVSLRAASPDALTVLGRGGVPSSGVAAVVLELRLRDGSAAGQLVAYPDGARRPATVSVSYAQGRNAAEVVVVAPGTRGKIRLAASAGKVTVAAAVVGYDARPGATQAGESFIPVTPSRIASIGQLAAGATSSVRVTGAGTIPRSGVAPSLSRSPR